MKKLYTSILCLGLLAPIMAQAEICTDFDDNMNIIEFDCAEGAENARKRIAAEQTAARIAQEKQAEQQRLEQERIAQQKKQAEEERNNAERAAREKQQELERATREKQRELERVAREKQQEFERLEREKQRATREKQRELERVARDARFQKKQQEIAQGGCWKFVAGLGGAFWAGQEQSSGVYLGETLRGYNGVSVQDASYSVGGFTLNAELAARYYLKNSPKWFWQIGLAYTSPLDHVIEIKQLSSSKNNVDDLEITTTMYSLQTMVGRMTWKNVYLYGKFGISYMDYAISGDLWFDRFGLKDGLSYTVGAGLEYSMWTWTSIYAGLDFVIPSSDTFKYADTLTSVNAGIRFQF